MHHLAQEQLMGSVPTSLGKYNRKFKALFEQDHGKDDMVVI